jgi:hypothetical protein
MPTMPHRIDRAKFFSKLKLNPVTGCLEWPGQTKNGYGVIYSTGGKFRTHRVSAYFAGMIDSPRGSNNGLDGKNVLHTCDNRKCCNPKHLFVGSHTDNNIDMRAKGRDFKFPIPIGPRRPIISFEKLKTGLRRSALKGEKHHNAKLTDAQIADIRMFYEAGVYSQGEMAKMFGVSQSTLSPICNGKVRNA